jgi:ribosomal peptide maturation radical SAM protein 1
MGRRIDHVDVAFAALPFADFQRPVIGASLLQAGLAAGGIRSQIEYFNIAFAEVIGAETYQLLANSLPPSCLAGEWFFADLVFGNAIPDAEDYLAKVLSLFLSSASAISAILEARKFRAQFIDSCAARLLALRPKIVGFPTSFHQTCACLAVAQQLKKAANPPLVFFGGANCEGEMGWQLILSFPWIDYVSTGEADISFPRFIAKILKHSDQRPEPGIIGKGDAFSDPERVSEMDALPIPDYTDFFDRARQSSLGEALNPVALIETSRGCWWGAKQHCTFCGLNGETMTFRSKSVQRSFREFASLTDRYQVKRIDCVDNILDTRYIQSLFPMLAESGLDLALFYEVKANLRYDQLELLRAGGVRGIQPGIESFSDSVLRIMKKGCTGFQNIQLLRWCQELGIEVVWNILAGFPGEPSAEYARQANLVPLLTHLQPPTGCTPIRLDRFSPFYMSPADFGFERVRPAAAYYYVFPLERRELARLAYFFEFDYRDGRGPNSYVKRLQEETIKWWNAHANPAVSKPRLDAKPCNDSLLIEDTREIAVKQRHILGGIPAALYLSCDTAKTAPALARSFNPVVNESDVHKILDDFVAAKTMIRYDDHYLSLAVFHDRPLLKELNQLCDIPKTQQAPAPEPLLRVV